VFRFHNDFKKFIFDGGHAPMSVPLYTLLVVVVVVVVVVLKEVGVGRAR